MFITNTSKLEVVPGTKFKKMNGKLKAVRKGAISKRQPKVSLQKLPEGVTEAQVRAHVISPAHIKKAHEEHVDEAKEVAFNFTSLGKPKLDLAKFGLTLNSVLKDLVVGYILQVRQHGNPVHVASWNWAQTPADQGKGWNEDTRMHLASVSKLLTAVGLVKLLKSNSLSIDTKIIDYLPAYWAKGSKIDEISFRHLMIHQSGFSTNGQTDYTYMKGKVAAGVSSVGPSGYQNMNYGLCRILIPIINGDISKNATFIDVGNDQAWDFITISRYQNYIQQNVLTPAGVNNGSFVPIPSIQNALAYPFPTDSKKGWNSGDLATVSGAAGWRLSVRELLNVMNHVRRKNTIIDKDTAQYMLDNYLGIDQVITTAGGTHYNKNGYWVNDDRRVEQSVAFFLPDDMELVLLVNSPIGSVYNAGQFGYTLRTIVSGLYINCLV